MSLLPSSIRDEFAIESGGDVLVGWKRHVVTSFLKSGVPEEATAYALGKVTLFRVITTEPTIHKIHTSTEEYGVHVTSLV